MKAIQAYLTFNGNAREAMTFYAKCLDAELTLMPFSEAPMETPPETKDWIMHSTLHKGSAILMASDNMPGMAFQPGNNISVCVQCESAPEIDRSFAAISEGGKVTMPLDDTFWGARFGMLIDKYGIQWMFNCEKPKQEGK